MPVSLRTAANFRNKDCFEIWNPSLDAFSGCVPGRLRRADPSVTVSHRNTRRDSIMLSPNSNAPMGAAVLRHSLSGEIFLIGQAPRVDAINGASYRETRRAHRVGLPSGGKGEYKQVALQGSGDNLGPVTLTTTAHVYMDVEFSVTYTTPGATASEVGEYLVFCSDNVPAREGDYLTLGNEYYRADQWFRESGFLCAKTVRLPPRFVTATFYYSGSGSPVFDPVTGSNSYGPMITRQVSVTIGEANKVGRPTDGVAESLVLYININHIGFSPELGMQVTIGARTYRVIKVGSRMENKQWKIEVAP